MPATIQREADNTYMLHLSGTLLRSEFAKVQESGVDDMGLRREAAHSGLPRKNFAGWEPGADWRDLDFLFSHSHEIEKIAIIGDSHWETEALAFAGAGFRRAPVKFFPTNPEAQARVWLEDSACLGWRSASRSPQTQQQPKIDPMKNSNTMQTPENDVLSLGGGQ